jgi:hypothetical protein
MTSGANQFQPKICPVCRGPKWSKHLEVCPGPMQRVAAPPVREPDPCECRPGMKHEYPCDLAHWPSGDAA